MSRDNRVRYQFGPFCLDIAEQQLRQDGHVLPLTPKVFDVLRVLVRNSGHLVEKDRLLSEVWPDSVVEEGALSRSVSILRKTLGDSEQSYIETVPKRGYRFTMPVIELDGSDPPEAPVDPKAMPSAVQPIRSRAAGWVAAGVLLIIGALASIGGGDRGTRGREMTASRPSPVHRQVTFTGKARWSAISPDGKRLAYVSMETPDSKLVVQELAGGPPLTLFTAPEIRNLRWSPDGAELIIVTRGAGRSGVYVLPQLGGTPRLIAQKQYVACWSPDGSTIAVASYSDGLISFYDSSGRLQGTTRLRNVTWSIWDIDWSAHGGLTVVSSDQQGRYTLWTVKPDGSEQRPLVESDSEIPAARWAPGANAVYYVRRVNQTFSLFRISAGTPSPSDAMPTEVVAGIEIDRLFGLSDDGKRLVYARAPYSSNLWLVNSNPVNALLPTTLELTHGTSLVERPSVSPDGASIVFNVGHEPTTNLYTMPIAGGDARQLTFRESLNLEAVWSADGKRIAFASTEGGRARVWTVNADGGDPVALPTNDMSEFVDLAWSPGGHILYQLPGNHDYHELAPDTGAERSLVRDSSVGWIFSPVYSPDRQKIAAFWNRPRGASPKRGVYVIDVKDRRERLVFEAAAAGTTGDSVWPIGWSADSRWIYIVDGKLRNLRGQLPPNGETTTEARILRVPTTGGDAETVVVLPFDEIGGVSVTPDGRRFVCVVYSSQSDVWVVEDFDPSLRASQSP